MSRARTRSGAGVSAHGIPRRSCTNWRSGRLKRDAEKRAEVEALIAIATAVPVVPILCKPGEKHGLISAPPRHQLTAFVALLCMAHPDAADELTGLFDVPRPDHELAAMVVKIASRLGIKGATQ